MKAVKKRVKMNKRGQQAMNTPNTGTQINTTKQVPTGVKVISVLYYIFAGISVTSALVSIIGGTALVSTLFGSLGEIVTLFYSIYIVVGILSLGLGVLCFFIARGLWRAKNWARIVVIVFSILVIAVILIPLIFLIMTIFITDTPIAERYGLFILLYVFLMIMQGLIAGYLLFLSLFFIVFLE
jgi:hypothetical protein